MDGQLRLPASPRYDWSSIDEAKSAIPYDSGAQIADMLEAAFRSPCS